MYTSSFASNPLWHGFKSSVAACDAPPLYEFDVSVFSDLLTEDEVDKFLLSEEIEKISKRYQHQNSAHGFGVASGEDAPCNDLLMIDKYLPRESEERTIDVPQNQILPPSHVPQFLEPHEPQNDKLFDVDKSLHVPQILIDEMTTVYIQPRKKMWVHDCALALSYPDEKTKIKMILLMRYIGRMAGAITEKLYKNRKLEYIELASHAFDLIDKNDHKWIKSYLSQMGIATRDHRYQAETGQSLRYYIADTSIFDKMTMIDVDKRFHSAYVRFERRILDKKIEQMNAYEKLATLGNAFFHTHLPSLETVIEHAPDESDKTKDNINKYKSIVTYGLSVPSMGSWHRCYSNAQNIAKWIRALTGLVEVDSKAMQPNLLLYLANKDGAITDAQYAMYSGDVYTNLCPELPRDICKDQLCKRYLSCEIGDMRETDVYTIIQSKLKALNEYAERYKQYNDISKDKSYTNLSRRLTQLEATLMFTAMSRAWAQGIECFYLYDAVLVEPHNAERMEVVMNAVFSEFGIRTWAENKSNKQNQAA